MQMAKSDLTQFDYKKVANLDARIWRAYYHHQFLRFAVLTYRLLRSQLRLNPIKTLLLAYYFSVASAEYRLNKNHMQSAKTLLNLVKFYKLISDNALEPFNYKEAAKRELDWWNIQRYERKDRGKLAAGLAKTFASVYHVPDKALLSYGKFRTEALDVKDEYLHRQKIEPNWNEIEELLMQSWQNLHNAIQK